MWESLYFPQYRSCHPERRDGKMRETGRERVREREGDRVREREREG
jgi:hypothetical protein